MTLGLFEIDQADQLSACSISLLLGVFTENNRVDRFLRYACKLLRVKSGILAFQNEPYIWHSSKSGFKVFQAEQAIDLMHYFNGEKIIAMQHENYHIFSQYMRSLGIEHQRIIAFDLKAHGRQIGYFVLFDDDADAFNTEDIDLVHEFGFSLMSLVELRSEYDELKELHEEQLALNHSKTKFFQIIAHDLRAPFHGLLGFSEVLAKERETLDELSVQDIADYLNDTVQSTYNLLENLLNWAMAEGGRFVYHPINFNLKQASIIVCDVLNPIAIKKKIQLIDEIPDHLRIHADINMVTSVIQNLVSNALKFTHIDGSGKVLIRAMETEKGVEIYISDTGLGMTSQQIEMVFEKSIQVSLKGTSGEKGTGLGLVLCKRFIELNQGEISVISKEGIGTTFKVLLPIALDSHRTLVHIEPNSIQYNKVESEFNQYNMTS